MKDKNREHFCGSIVSIMENDSMVVIDGQQRITTVALLLLAICKYLENVNKEPKIRQKIYENYLLSRSKNNNKLKLKVSKNNKNDFEFLLTEFDIDKIRNSKSQIFENFLYFYDKISKEYGEKIKILINGVERLVVVDILLKQGSNPQPIFETLNSTGIALKESDLIRNYILMNLEHKKQEILFNNYWEKISANIKNDEIEFFRNYLYFKTLSHNIKNNTIYVAFKKLYDADYSKEKIAEDLLKYSDYYRQIKDYSIFDGGVKELLRNLLAGDFLDCEVIITYLFSVIDKVNEKELSVSDFREILEILESYLFRQFVCKIRNQNLRNMFISLIKQIGNSKNNYIESLIYFLNEHNFPNDSLFRDKFTTFEFYKNSSPSSQVQHIFTEIEKLNSREIVCDGLSLEHIAPQTLNGKWQEYLGEDFENVKNIYIHTIGNLTITGYNGKLSNKSFEDKKLIYKNSNINLTRELAKLDVWNLNSIKSRAEKLADKAIMIWKYYTATIQIEKKEREVFLSEQQEFDFTNYKAVKVTINDEEITGIKFSWRNVYYIIMKYCYDLDRDKFLEQIKTDRYFNKNNYNNPVKLTDNITFESCFSTNQGLAFMKEFVDKFNDYRVNSENILFVIKKRK
jgi:uncharacterized protein with ParB-like and HNH nuclease domain